MNCPFCPHDGSRMEIHAHLADKHPERVILGHHDGPNDPYFEIGCPWCEQQAVQSVNPGGRDPAFLQEFQREVRLRVLFGWASWSCSGNSYPCSHFG